MIVHDLVQGSPEWLAYRAQHLNASDAPAMMGCSPYKTRSELLRELHTGMAADVDANTQRLFDAGHRFEALARPLAEAIIGQSLYPVVGSAGRLSASFDGLTLADDIVFEHKTASAELRAVMTGEDCGPALPLHYRVQMEQQLMVSGADRALFMATLWDGDTCTFSRHCWYEPDAELRASILRGWDQFAADLAAYKLPAAAEPAPTGRAPDTLPALHIEVTGQVTASNLLEFKATALSAIRAVNRDLQTDADFANADKAVKWCADVEARLKAAKEHALSQTASIDALFRTLDDIGAESKAVRLDLAKLIDRRKIERKEEAIAAARRALDLHIAAVNADVAPMRIQPVPVDFAGAIKGLRSFASMDDALSTALAAAKIEADARARIIRTNVTLFEAKADGLGFLFVDLGHVIHKAPDDFAALVDSRIAAHRAAEAAKEAKRKADEAAKEAKRKADEAARIAAAEQRAREQEAARIAEQQRREEEDERRIQAAHADEARRQAAPQSLVQDECRPLSVALASKPDAPAHARDAVAAIVAANDPATLNLTAINARFGGRIKLDAAGLAMMGIEHSATDKAAMLYRESDIGRICRALVVLAAEVCNQQ